MVRTKHSVNQILELLYRRGKINTADMHKVHTEFESSQHDSLTTFLLDEGLVSDEDLFAALALFYNVPSYDVRGHFFERTLLHQFPKDLLLREGFIPLEVDQNTLLIVAADPSDERLLLLIGSIVSYDISFLVGLRRDICDAVKEYYDKSLTDIPRDDEVHEHNTSLDAQDEANNIKKN